MAVNASGSGMSSRMIESHLALIGNPIYLR
jgi:hypothetical protein